MCPAYLQDIRFGEILVCIWTTAWVWEGGVHGRGLFQGRAAENQYHEQNTCHSEYHHIKTLLQVERELAFGSPTNRMSSSWCLNPLGVI